VVELVAKGCSASNAALGVAQVGGLTRETSCPSAVANDIAIASPPVSRPSSIRASISRSIYALANPRRQLWRPAPVGHSRVRLALLKMPGTAPSVRGFPERSLRKMREDVLLVRRTISSRSCST
jgi:hypothetical protein